MAADIPEFKKSCFFIPLKYGITAWGLASVIISVVLLAISTGPIIWSIKYYFLMSRLLFYIVMSTIGIVHIVYNLMAIVAVFKKNLNLMRHYYKYSIVRIMGYITLMITLHILNASGIYLYGLDSVWIDLFMYTTSLAIIEIMLQGYFILVVRSYLLRNDEDYQDLEADDNNTSEDPNIPEK